MTQQQSGHAAAASFGGHVELLELVNTLARGQAPPAADLLAALAAVLAVDPPSVAQLKPAHVPGFVALARELLRVLERLGARDDDGAAARLNALLARHPAHPHLAKEDGRWRLHHHPAEAALVPMWTAICAEALARRLALGDARRFGVCEAESCGRVYFDESRNASRRFCSTTCQNRVKAAAFRLRHGQGTARAKRGSARASRPR